MKTGWVLIFLAILMMAWSIFSIFAKLYTGILIIAPVIGFMSSPFIFVAGIIFIKGLAPSKSKKETK